MRAVVLLSGGLDSILAARVMLEQGVELEALNFVSVFCTCTPGNSSCSAATRTVGAIGAEKPVLAMLILVNINIIDIKPARKFRFNECELFTIII